MLYVFVYIMFLTTLNIVMKMIGKNKITPKVDLRKKTSVMDTIQYSDLDFQSCMVMLMVIVALLLSVISVATAHSPLI